MQHLIDNWTIYFFTEEIDKKYLKHLQMCDTGGFKGCSQFGLVYGSLRFTFYFRTWTTL